MLRVRFHANYEDSRPVHWPVKHPFWESGIAADESYAIVVSYADELKFWKRTLCISSQAGSQSPTGFNTRRPIPRAVDRW